MTAKISDAEYEILKVLLEMKRATAVELHHEVSKTRPWAHSTVVTFLRRLEAKGLAQHKALRGSKAFVYHPTRLAQGAPKAALRTVLERVFGGDPLPLVSSLLEQTRLSSSQLDELRRLIDEHASKQGDKP